MKILLVEDSPTDRELLRYLLDDLFRSEAKFREADNLETAFRYLESGGIDCVVLDLQLPDSAGRETFVKLNERFPDVPIIVMTHNKDRTLALDMIKAGAADYILKDYTNSEDIFRRIVFAVEKHRRTVRVMPEKANAVHTLERAKANMLSAHQSGEHQAIQSTTVATTSAVADLSKRMFTELQTLSNQLAEKRARDERVEKVLDSLETEILKGSGGRPSMRSSVDLLEHRMTTSERRFSDFKELTEKKLEATDEKTEKKIGEIRSNIKTTEDTQRLSAVHIQQATMSNRTKVIIGLISFLGVIATTVGSCEVAKLTKDKPKQEQKDK